MVPQPAAVDESFLPLKPVVFQILLALAQQEQHGYGVLQSVRENSRGRVHLETGPLYRHLRRLLDDGLASECEAAPSDDPRRGRHYRLTRLGRRALEAETARLEQALQLSRRLGFSAGESGS